MELTRPVLDVRCSCAQAAEECGGLIDSDSQCRIRKKKRCSPLPPVLLRISWPTTVAMVVFQLLQVVNICCAPVLCSVLGVSPVLCSVLGNAKTMEKS